MARKKTDNETKLGIVQVATGCFSSADIPIPQAEPSPMISISAVAMSPSTSPPRSIFWL